jgi:hypothetical protein
MPFNLSDKSGKNIGFIVRRYRADVNEQVYMVALSEKGLQDSGIERQKMLDRLAIAFNCKNMLGRINESKLEEVMNEKWQQEKSKLGDISYEAFLIYSYLHTVHDFNLDIPQEEIRGFILMDLGKVSFHRDAIVLEDELDYIDEPVILDEPPLYAKITEHPVMAIDVMGMEGLFFGGGLADLGGRNHTHETTLTIKSGNCEKRITVPIPFYATKGKPVQLYFKNRKLAKVFCDLFYSLS